MLEIIYEDDCMLAVRKPAGQESQASRGFGMDLEHEIRNYLARQRKQSEMSRAGLGDEWRAQGEPPYVGVVHRLDRPVAGVMVYAKTRQAAAALSEQLREGAHKEYEALVRADAKNGLLQEAEGEERLLEDWLVMDHKSGTSRVTSAGEPGAKLARLRLRSIPWEECVCFSLEEEQMGLAVRSRAQLLWTGAGSEAPPMRPVRIQLLTGRHHQIRVQLAHAGLPIWGDDRYAQANGTQGSRGTFGTEENGRKKNSEIALCAVRLTLRHPLTGERMVLEYEGA